VPTQARATRTQSESRARFTRRASQTAHVDLKLVSDRQQDLRVLFTERDALLHRGHVENRVAADELR
jgi:hypothetical protein